MNLGQLKSAPNQLTLLRLVFIPFIVNAVMESQFRLALGLFVLAGISDGLDGLLARKMNQRTELGHYLDPVADKLLLSTMFIVLAVVHEVPWRITILVLCRDFAILLVSALLYMTTSLRDFSPSFFGKANTLAQIVAALLVLLDKTVDAGWIANAREVSLWAVFALTLISGLHYIWLVGTRLRDGGNKH
ncbi:MAG: CDP-alcohol phosphatidyltransferase family protein [Acidobacteriales bacterium]|nr:CDP-alcohol phosphatidyltransferase family protein [Terriglobales bacterium]